MKAIECRAKVVYYTRLADADTPDVNQGRDLTVVEGENLLPAGKQIIIWSETRHGIVGSFQDFAIFPKQSDNDVYAVFRIYEDGRTEGIGLSGSSEAHRLFEKAIWPE